MGQQRGPRERLFYEFVSINSGAQSNQAGERRRRSDKRGSGYSLQPKNSDGRVEDDPVARPGVQRDPISYGIKIPVVITYLKNATVSGQKPFPVQSPSPATR
jgi:hypothetical protein